MPRYRHKRRTLIILTLFTTISIVCSRSLQTSRPSNDRSRYHQQSFLVAKVVDGDTFDIHAPDQGKPVTRIRLWGVDTPEVSRSGKGNMHFGPEASAFAKQTLEDRKVYIVLASKKSRGKYGRLLAYVFLERGGQMFNEMLLEQGYAYADLRFKHIYYDQFKSIDQRAAKLGTGLWADITLDKMPKWKQRFAQRKNTNDKEE